MHRRIFASLVALAIGGTHALALAQTSGLDADAPTSSDVRVGEIVSASGLPATPDAERLERRRVVRDHRGGNTRRPGGGVTVRRSNDSDRGSDDGNDKRGLKDRIKEEIKDKVKDKAKEKIEKEKDKLKERAKKEKNKYEKKIKDKISDWLD